MTLVLETIEALKAWRRKQGQKTVGFVPTMGALHAGHETLLKRARAENDTVILSLFVNPTQFNDPNDLAKYPKTFEADLLMAQKNHVDAIFLPTPDLMYPDQYRYTVTEKEASKDLCGADRPGHFDGVLTVVLKLFNLVAPTRAYFGEKDYQQLSLIRGMADAFFLDLEIIPVATVRETDGLALSSRNVRLTDAARQKAPKIFGIIRNATSESEARQHLEAEGFMIDYVRDKDGRRFVAIKMDSRDGGFVRLIDNVPIA